MEPKWTYFLAYSPLVASDLRMKIFLDKHPRIQNWHICIPNTAIVVSSMTAGQLTDAIRKRFPKGRFVVLDTETDRNGYLPKLAWDMMKAPSEFAE